MGDVFLSSKFLFLSPFCTKQFFFDVANKMHKNKAGNLKEKNSTANINDQQSSYLMIPWLVV